MTPAAFVLVALTTLITSGDALMCYKCYALRDNGVFVQGDQNCEDPYRGNESHKEVCTTQTQCAKTTWTWGTQTYVGRACLMGVDACDNPKVTVVESGVPKTYRNFCCGTDRCNQAGSLSVTKSVVALMVCLVAMATYMG